MEPINVIIDIVNFFLKVISVLQNAEGTMLETIATMYPEAIAKILENPDFVAMYQVVVPVGTLLAVVYCSMDIMEKASIELITVDKVIFAMFKLVVALALISNGIIIFQGLNAISEMLVEKMADILSVSEYTISTDTIASGEVESYSGAGIAFLFFIVKLLNPVFLFQLLGDIFSLVFVLILIPIAAYQRAIKVGYYCMAAPIILSDTAGRGIRTSHAMNFLFGLMRIMLEYPIAWLGVAFVMELNSAGYLTFGTLSTMLIATTLLYKATSWAKTLV